MSYFTRWGGSRTSWAPTTRINRPRHTSRLRGSSRVSSRIGSRQSGATSSKPLSSSSSSHSCPPLPPPPPLSPTSSAAPQSGPRHRVPSRSSVCSGETMVMMVTMLHGHLLLNLAAISNATNIPLVCSSAHNTAKSPTTTQSTVASLPSPMTPPPTAASRA